LDDFKREISAELLCDPSKFYVGKYSKAAAPSKSPLWTRFGPIIADSDSSPVLFHKSATSRVKMVACVDCLTVYAYSSVTGTSTLNKHTCPNSVVVAGGSHGIEQFCRPKVMPSIGQKLRMKNALADFCAEDIRPFHIVGGDGFLGAMQTAYDIGAATKQPMDIRTLVCVPRTVKVATRERYIKLKETVKKVLNIHFKDKLSAGATTDIWTDSVNNISYMSVTLHDIDSNFHLHARTVSCDQFPPGCRHTAPEILANFVAQIGPFVTMDDDVVAADEQVVATTDSASNNIAADGLPSKFEHEPCKCHKIGTCVSFILDKRTIYANGKKSKPFYEFLDEAPAVFECIEACKELVTYAKHTQINKLLTPQLIQHNPARWDGLLTMLNSIVCEWDAHREVFVKEKKETKIDAICFIMADELVRFLHVFRLASKALEAFLTPTIHLVAF